MRFVGGSRNPVESRIGAVAQIPTRSPVFPPITDFGTGPTFALHHCFKSIRLLSHGDNFGFAYYRAAGQENVVPVLCVGPGRPPLSLGWVPPLILPRMVARLHSSADRHFFGGAVLLFAFKSVAIRFPESMD